MTDETPTATAPPCGGCHHHAAEHTTHRDHPDDRHPCGVEGCNCADYAPADPYRLTIIGAEMVGEGKSPDALDALLESFEAVADTHPALVLLAVPEHRGQQAYREVETVLAGQSLNAGHVIEAIGWLSSELARLADDATGHGRPTWFPEPPEWLALWQRALAATAPGTRTEEPA